MVQIRSSDVASFLSEAARNLRIILFHGSDDGVVAERAAALADAVLKGQDDPMARISLDAATVAADPGLLMDEAHAIGMFGGRRVISLRLEGPRNVQPAVQTVMESPPQECWIILLGGELRKGSGLRALCEKHAAAAVVACYADDDRSLDQLIDEETNAAGLTMSHEARAALKSQLGADRRITRAEIRKLTTYAAGSAEINLDDVRAIVGDVSAFAIGEAVDSMVLGNTNGFDRAYRRLVASGTPGVVVAGAAQRHFDFLHTARWAADRGTPLDTIIGRARPPIFYQRRPQVKRQIGMWSLARIERALDILDSAVLASRLHGAIGDTVTAEAMMRLAAVAAGTRTRQR